MTGVNFFFHGATLSAPVPLQFERMNNSLKQRSGLEKAVSYITVFIAGAVLCAAVIWMTGVVPGFNSRRNNSIMTITPYLHNGTWVFDDPSVGLIHEPFVSGVPEMITAVTKDISDAKQGFNLTFSANQFPGYEHKLTWVREESSGHFYRLDNPDLEGWLCPAMFQYFAEPPPVIYVSAEPATR